MLPTRPCILCHFHMFAGVFQAFRITLRAVRLRKRKITIIPAGRLRSLKSLGLSNNAITDQGCLLLADAMERGQLPNLSDLFMSKNAAVSDDCAAALGKAISAKQGTCGSPDGHCGAARLERLGLNENSISDAGLSRLLASLTKGSGIKLRELSLNNNSRLCREASTLLAAMEGVAVALRARAAFSGGSGGGGKRNIKLSLRSVRCRKQKQTWELTDATRAGLDVVLR